MRHRMTERTPGSGGNRPAAHRSRVAGPNDLAPPEEPQDARRALEGAEHEREATVLVRWAIVSTPLPVRSR